MTDFQKTYLNKNCFIIYNDKFYYNGVITSIENNILIIEDKKIGDVSLPIDKCVVNLKEGRV